MNIKEIPANKLQISKYNVRTLTKDDTYLALKDNIKQHGLLNPLTVIYNESTDIYEIIAGQRRFTVLTELNYSQIPCNIIASDNSSLSQIVLSLTENIHRNNMKLSEKVKTCKTLQKHYQSNNELAQAIGISNTIVKQYLEISHLPDTVLDKLDAKGYERINLDFAVSLTKLGCFNEGELLTIINLFHDVCHKDRNKIMKKIMNTEKYGSDEFYIYIEKIGKIKVEEHEKIKQETDNLKKAFADAKHTVRILEAESNLSKNNDLVITQCSVTATNLTNSKLTIDQYNEKMKMIISNNSNSVYIMSKVRCPELQMLFRNEIIKRFKTCIVSGLTYEVCEAAHIVPFSECNNFNIDNGLLLNSILHSLFDKYYWSINPETLCLEIFYKSNDIYEIIKPYNNKKIDILCDYPNVILNITIHYNKAKSLFK
jgi:ParB/RepB/Spo0J family partition protein